MSLAKITLIGMYNYDPTLFDGLTVPEQLDKDVLVGNILMQSGDFETLYGSVPFMKNAIGLWSAKWQDTFERWCEAMTAEYNPLENYDRNEEWDDKNTGDQTMVKSGNETFGKAGTEVHTGSGNETNAQAGSEKDEAGGGNTTTNKVSAFDSSTLATHDESSFSTTQSNTHTFTNRVDTHTLNDLTDTLSYNNRVDTTTFNNVQDKRTDNLNLNHKGRVHGNIGVTTSQQMLESEMVLRLKWNLYNQITDLFLTEFVLPIY